MAGFEKERAVPAGEAYGAQDVPGEHVGRWSPKSFVSNIHSICTLPRRCAQTVVPGRATAIGGSWGAHWGCSERAASAEPQKGALGKGAARRGFAQGLQGTRGR